jgi:fermentation-respiration switch protein FrsA (DUF1100 family)
MSFQTIPRFFILAAIAYAAYALLLFLMQRQLMYPGRHIKVSGAPPPGIETLKFETSAGQNAAWFMPPIKLKPGERRPLVIFFHGNGEVIDYLPKQVEGFRNLGMGVLLVEYPGFGRSSGDPTESSITETVVAAYDAVLKRDVVDSQRIIIFGRSLGGGAACALAALRPSAALIMQSAFSSTRPFAHAALLPGFLVRDQFDNGKVVTAYQQPILLFHGSRDTTIPPDHSRRLKSLAANARLIELPCDHNDCPPDWNEFYRIIAVFLKDAGVLQ